MQKNNIKNVKISSDKLHIENDFFRNFESLENVDFDVSTDILFIPKTCFYCKTKLTRIVIPKSIRIICEKAFKNCVNLETVEINSVSPLFIKDEAFYNCSSLLSIKIPNLISQIGKKAFMNCIKLKEFDTLKSERIAARMSEKLPEGIERYIVRIGLTKFIISVTNDNIEYLMAL